MSSVSLPATTDHDKLAPSSWQLIADWAERFAASRSLVMAAFTTLFLFPTLHLCHTKLFWDDEFFTLYLSRTPDWTTLLRALATGADQHPPSFYFLTHWILTLFGTSHITLRLTSIFGFWLLCVCLYEIGRSLATPLWAVVAMLFPLSTNFYYYATEARGYGLVTGFAALAVLCWLRASVFRHRRLYLPLLAVSVTGAVASHYYAALMVLCLAAGELARTRVRRQVDLPIWLAFACSLLPVVLFRGTIRSASVYAHHFWAVPVWSDAITFYPAELGLGLVTLLGIVALALSFRSKLSHYRTLPSGDPVEHWNVWHATAIYALTSLPIITIFVAKFITHGFSNRYAISALVGATTLTCYLVSRICPQPLIALSAAVSCLCIFALQVHTLGSKFHEDRAAMAQDTRILSQTGHQQVVIMEVSVMHRLSFYAPRELASRLTYLSDPDASIQYLGQDTVDRGLLDLSPWFPLKALPAQSFLATHQSFLVFGGTSSWSWLTFDLPQWGHSTLLSRWEQGRMLFAVDDVHVAPSPARQQDPVESRMLFRTLPQTGPSLCDLYMGPHECP
jgi:hypothetical protein